MLPAMRELMGIESRCAHVVLVPDSMPVSAAVEDLLILKRG
jgi:hypothetical protein